MHIFTENTIAKQHTQTDDKVGKLLQDAQTNSIRTSVLAVCLSYPKDFTN